MPWLRRVPQAIAQWLPQLSANGSAAREKVAFASGPALGNQAADCAIGPTVYTQRCYGTAHTLELNQAQAFYEPSRATRHQRAQCA